jgi:hypothetical protein
MIAYCGNWHLYQSRRNSRLHRSFGFFVVDHLAIPICFPTGEFQNRAVIASMCFWMRVVPLDAPAGGEA